MSPPPKEQPPAQAPEEDGGQPSLASSSSSSSTTLKRPLAPKAASSPSKKQTKWTPEEDALIVELRGRGDKWEDISKSLPGRSALSCRLHYQNYLERRPEWDEEKKNLLARLYERFVLLPPPPPLFGGCGGGGGGGWWPGRSMLTDSQVQVGDVADDRHGDGDPVEVSRGDALAAGRGGYGPSSGSRSLLEEQRGHRRTQEAWDRRIQQFWHCPA